jgi:hypothetical protein
MVIGKVKPFFLDTQGKLHHWGDTTQKTIVQTLQASFATRTLSEIVGSLKKLIMEKGD